MGTPAQKSPRALKVAVFDGIKVHDFLFHVALAQVWWHDLKTNPQNLPTSLVQNQRARADATRLYADFLVASRKGHKQAATFLKTQGEWQKTYLRESEAILQSRQLAAACHTARLSEIAFGVQLVKSTAVVGVAGLGFAAAFLLAAPELMTVALIGLGFDLSLEIIKKVSHSDNDSPVVVGFTAVNDTVGVGGSWRGLVSDSRMAAKAQTLAYPLKSSIFRSMAFEKSFLDGLGKIFGGAATLVALYTESVDSYDSFENMRRSQQQTDQPARPNPRRLP